MSRVDLIHVSRLFFKSNILDIEGMSDTNYLGKHPWKFGGFRDEKQRWKVEMHVRRAVGHRISHSPIVQSLFVGPLGSAPARAPQLGL